MLKYIEQNTSILPELAAFESEGAGCLIEMIAAFGRREKTSQLDCLHVD